MTMRAMRYDEGTAPSVSPDTIPNVSNTTLGVMYPRPSPTMDYSPRLRFCEPEAAIPILPNETFPPPLGARDDRGYPPGSDVRHDPTHSTTESERLFREIVINQSRVRGDSTFSVSSSNDIGSPGSARRWPLGSRTGTRFVHPWNDPSVTIGNRVDCRNRTMWPTREVSEKYGDRNAQFPAVGGVEGSGPAPGREGRRRGLGRAGPDPGQPARLHLLLRHRRRPRCRPHRPRLGRQGPVQGTHLGAG